MALDFELVRGDERLECDWFVWRDTIGLARAFGWKPKSINLKRQTLTKWADDEAASVEVADEDAQSLARAILQSIGMLAMNQRPTRKQMASLIWFTGGQSGSGAPSSS